MDEKKLIFALEEIQQAIDRVGEHVNYSQMPMRDQFAMAALQGMLGNRTYDPPRRKKADKFCEDAYLFADAMIKARQE